MGYCGLGWSSDYTYEAVLAFRARGNVQAPGPSGPVLVVWGRVSDTELVVEPAFVLPSASRSEDAAGPYRLEGLDATGDVIFGRSFEGVEVGDGAHGERHFFLTLPLAEAQPERIAGLRIHAEGHVTEVRSSVAGSSGRAASFESAIDAITPRRVGADRVRVQWDAARFPLLVVRDAVRGEILSFARGGDVVLRTAARQLDLTLSDGVGSSPARSVRVE